MKDVGFGRSLLKLVALLCTTCCLVILVLAIMSLTNKFPQLNEMVENQINVTDFGIQLPENFPGLALMVSFAFALVETYLMWRAVKEPKKSVFLILLNIVILLGSGIFAIIKGVSGTSTSTILWSTVALIALLCARSEVVAVVRPKKAKVTKESNEIKEPSEIKQPTTKETKATRTRKVKAVKKEEVKEGSK